MNVSDNGWNIHLPSQEVYLYIRVCNNHSLGLLYLVFGVIRFEQFLQLLMGKRYYVISIHL